MDTKRNQWTSKPLRQKKSSKQLKKKKHSLERVHVLPLDETFDELNEFIGPNTLTESLTASSSTSSTPSTPSSTPSSPCFTFEECGISSSTFEKRKISGSKQSRKEETRERRRNRDRDYDHLNSSDGRNDMPYSSIRLKLVHKIENKLTTLRREINERRIEAQKLEKELSKMTNTSMCKLL